MKIHVVFTGGTIASRSKNGVISLSDGAYALLDRYVGDDEFETSEPYSILSESLTPDRFLRLAAHVAEVSANAQAVIVTHGTDTLCYSAAALSFLLPNIKVPVIFVSSGYPLDDPKANGDENFAAAIAFAKERRKGVYAVWNFGGESRIHYGVRLLAQQAYSDMLCSVGEGFVGTVSDGKFYENKSAPPFERREISFGDYGTVDALAKNADGFEKIIALKCMPGMYYPDPRGAAAVMLESYHSGTLCADLRFAEFMRRARALEVPVFVAGAGGREEEYETAALYLKEGAIALPAASPSAMYVKLGLAASFGFDLVKAAR